MKKYIAVALLLFCLAGCGDDADDTGIATTTPAITGTSVPAMTSDVAETTPGKYESEEQTESAEDSTYAESVPVDVTTESAEPDDGGKKPVTSAVNTTKETEKKETTTETSPFTETLPNVGGELPDDVWE